VPLAKPGRELPLRCSNKHTNGNKNKNENQPQYVARTRRMSLRTAYSVVAGVPHCDAIRQCAKLPTSSPPPPSSTSSTSGTRSTPSPSSASGSASKLWLRPRHASSAFAGGRRSAEGRDLSEGEAVRITTPSRPFVA
jgi:hypothetical protein